MIAAQAVSAAPWALLFHGLITTLGECGALDLLSGLPRPSRRKDEPKNAL
jgi:hypothetical protein